MDQQTVTLITGANKGMGLEIALELGQRGQTILVGARNRERGQAAVTQLAEQGVRATFIQLDVTDATSIAQAAQQIKTDYGYLSILINNAGAAFDQHQAPATLPTSVMRRDFDINFFGLIDVTQALLPLLLKAPAARIINISSMMGSLTASLMPGAETYRASAVGYQASKAAANMFTVQLAKQLAATDAAITVNAVDPGMVATEFGGSSAATAQARGAKTPAEGVARTVALATRPTIDTATFTNTHGIVPW